MNFSCDLLAIP